MACEPLVKILSVRNATVKVAGQLLLDKVNVNVSAGKVTCIVGPNGAGKSTLLKAIGADVDLHSGEIYFAGKCLQNWNAQARARQLAILPQNCFLNFPYSVEEVVGLGRIPHATGLKVDDVIVREAMKAFDVLHLAERYYTQLSGGEKQRVQLARVFSQVWSECDQTHRLLILDEPVNSLDLKHQKQLMNMIRQFAEAGVAVLMVLHDIQLVSQYADTVVVLQEGNVFLDGPVEDVLTQSTIRQVFGADVLIVPHPLNAKPVVIL